MILFLNNQPLWFSHRQTNLGDKPTTANVVCHKTNNSTSGYDNGSGVPCGAGTSSGISTNIASAIKRLVSLWGGESKDVTSGGQPVVAVPALTPDNNYNGVVTKKTYYHTEGPEWNRNTVIDRVSIDGNGTDTLKFRYSRKNYSR